MLLVSLTHYSTIQLDYPDHTEARQFKLHARIVIDVYLVEQTTLTQEQSSKLKGELWATLSDSKTDVIVTQCVNKLVLSQGFKHLGSPIRIR